MHRDKILELIELTLSTKEFKDYSPNGLQISGCANIEHIITGVSICKKLINKAIELNAGMILVHHGFFWQNEDPRIIGIKQERIKLILNNNINVAGYHLPLDAHLTLGNNAQLAKLLDITIEGTFPNKYVFYGKLKKPLTVSQLEQKIATKLNRDPLVIRSQKTTKISTVVWCSGGAQKHLLDAIDFKADAYITGEISEFVTHLAEESNTHYFSCGHHATERYGIQALGNHLADKLGIKHTYVELLNPV